MLTATHIINLLPVQSLGFKTPFELLYQTLPNYLHLRVFGCLCYATKVYIHDKFESRAIKGVLLGYPFGKKGYKIFDLQSKKSVYSRDVTFVESTFPFHTSKSSVSSNSDSSFTSLFPTLPISVFDSPLSQLSDEHIVSPETTVLSSHPISTPTLSVDNTEVVPSEIVLIPSRPVRTTHLPARF